MAGYYICNKRNCDRFGEEIPFSEISDSNFPKCPGTTQSGDPCGGDLEFHKKSSPIIKILKPAGGVLVVAALVSLIWFVILPIFSGGADPSISVQPGTLTFPQPTDGAASSSIQISNQGDGDLVLTQIQVSPSQFTTTKNELQVKPDESATLFINYSSVSTEGVKGEITLQTNDPKKSSVTVALVVNPSEEKDPWWVYEQLEAESSMYRTNGN